MDMKMQLTHRIERLWVGLWQVIEIQQVNFAICHSKGFLAFLFRNIHNMSYEKILIDIV